MRDDVADPTPPSILQPEDVRRMLAIRCDLAGGIRKLAHDKRVPVAVIWEVLDGSPPGPTILDLLGLERVHTYRRRS